MLSESEIDFLFEKISQLDEGTQQRLVAYIQKKSSVLIAEEKKKNTSGEQVFPSTEVSVSKKPVTEPLSLEDFDSIFKHMLDQLKTNKKLCITVQEPQRYLLTNEAKSGLLPWRIIYSPMNKLFYALHSSQKLFQFPCIDDAHEHVKTYTVGDLCLFWKIENANIEDEQSYTHALDSLKRYFDYESFKQKLMASQPERYHPESYQERDIFEFGFYESGGVYTENCSVNGNDMIAVAGNHVSKNSQQPSSFSINGLDDNPDETWRDIGSPVSELSNDESDAIFFMEPNPNEENLTDKCSAISDKNQGSNNTGEIQDFFAKLTQTREQIVKTLSPSSHLTQGEDFNSALTSTKSSMLCDPSAHSLGKHLRNNAPIGFFEPIHQPVARSTISPQKSLSSLSLLALKPLSEEKANNLESLRKLKLSSI